MKITLNYTRNIYIIMFLILFIVSSCDSVENAKHQKSRSSGAISYYPSGIPKTEEFVIGDVGKEVIQYFNSQDTFLVKRDSEYYKIFEPRVKKYQFVNNNNNIAFEQIYEEKKELKNNFGRSLITYWSPKKVSVNEKWLLQVIVPVPPYSSNEIKVYAKMLRKNSEELTNKKLKEVFFEFDTTFSKVGKYEILIISTIEAKKTLNIQSDSVKFILEVI